MIDIVFLDAGETILHPHPSFPELFSMTLREHDIEVAPELVAPILFGMLRNWSETASEADVENASLTPEGSRKFWTYVYRKCLTTLGVSQDLSDELYAVFSSSSTYRLFDDALPAIRELKDAGYRVGLISNFEEWLEEMLVELEVGDMFDVRVISGLVGVEKPDPRIYELGLEEARVPAHAAVHVGDSIMLDVEPAAATGMQAILLDRAGRHADFEGHVIGSLGELHGIIRTL
jgi:putative hydrolase of the HAD superfamily